MKRNLIFNTKVLLGVATLSAVGVAGVVGLSTTSTTPSQAISASLTSATSTSLKALPGQLKHHFGFHATEEFYSKKLGQTITFTLDRGVVTSASASSISVLEPNGSTVTDAVSTTTKFGKLSLTQIESDLSASTTVHAILLQRNGVLTHVRAVAAKTATPSSASTSSSVSA